MCEKLEELAEEVQKQKPYCSINSNDISKASTRKDMKNQCIDNVKCKRELINEHFGFETPKQSNCCNICNPLVGLEWNFDK